MPGNSSTKSSVPFSLLSDHKLGDREVLLPSFFIWVGDQQREQAHGSGVKTLPYLTFPKRKEYCFFPLQYCQNNYTLLQRQVNILLNADIYYILVQQTYWML